MQHTNRVRRNGSARAASHQSRNRTARAAVKAGQPSTPDKTQPGAVTAAEPEAKSPASVNGRWGGACMVIHKPGEQGVCAKVQLNRSDYALLEKILQLPGMSPRKFFEAACSCIVDRHVAEATSVTGTGASVAGSPRGSVPPTGATSQNGFISCTDAGEWAEWRLKVPFPDGLEFVQDGESSDDQFATIKSEALRLGITMAQVMNRIFRSAFAAADCGDKVENAEARMSRSDLAVLRSVAQIQGKLEARELLELARSCEACAAEYRHAARVLDSNPHAWDQIGWPARGAVPCAIGGAR